MDESKLQNFMTSTMQNVKNLVSADTVVGEPITTPDGIYLIPLVKVSYGFGGGGAEFAQSKGYGGGTAYGVKVEPIGFLVVKDGNIRLMNVTPQAHNTLDRIVDQTPEVMDKLNEMVDKIVNRNKDKEA